MEDGWIWFERGLVQHVYRIRLDGTHLAQVTRQPMREEFIGLSGNHQWLIFTGDEYDRDIYRVRVNGSWPHRLVNLPGHDRALGYLGNGDWLLFTNTELTPAYRHDLWRVNTNTGEMQQLTQSFGFTDIAISPDRQWIYLLFYDKNAPDTPDKGADLARLRVDGTDFQQLTFTANINVFCYKCRLMWAAPQAGEIFTLSPISPDGQWFLLSLQADTPTGEAVFGMTTDGQNMHQLYFNGEILGWSPDSQWIYYKALFEYDLSQQTQPQRGQYYRIHPDGTGRQLLSSRVFDMQGHLSKDGKWIFVEDWHKYYAIATDGSGEWLVSTGINFVVADMLSPNRRWYYFFTTSFDFDYAELYRSRVGVPESAEKIGNFQRERYAEIDLFGWYESPNKHWSPVLIFGVSVGAMGVAVFMAWKSRDRR